VGPFLWKSGSRYVLAVSHRRLVTHLVSDLVGRLRFKKGQAMCYHATTCVMHLDVLSRTRATLTEPKSSFSSSEPTSASMEGHFLLPISDFIRITFYRIFLKLLSHHKCSSCMWSVSHRGAVWIQHAGFLSRVSGNLVDVWDQIDSRRP